MTHSSARKMTSRMKRGAQVVARHHQQAQHGGTGHERHQHVPPVGQLAQLLLAGEQVRAPHREGELGDLGRLDLLAADLDPPRRAVLRDADATDEREAEPDHGDREQRVGEGPEQPWRRARRQPHQRQADGGAQKLLLEVGVRREPRGQVDHRRGGLHHDQAEAEQQRSDTQHEVVGRERPVEQRAPHADPVPHAAQARQPHRILGRQVQLREIVNHGPSLLAGPRQDPDIRCVSPRFRPVPAASGACALAVGNFWRRGPGLVKAPRLSGMM